ncbi:hypothetical protein [Pseudoalteromonas sp. B160]|uniref:hypothetical protein n=1 Tax=Pseudoalteromonas sp. B160 TaxID=630414 RepID=UPI00301C80A5
MVHFFATAIAVAIGLYHVLNLPNYYTSSVVLVSEKSEDSVGSGLGKLTSLAGISMPRSGADKLSIAIKLLESRNFIGKFFEENKLEADFFAVKEWDQTSNSLVYNSEVYKDGKWLRKESALKSSKPTYKELTERFINNNLVYKQDKESGFMSISVTHYSPYIARDTLESLVNFINEESRLKAINTSNKKIEYLADAIQRTENASMKSAFYDMLLLEEKDKMLASVNSEYVFTVLDPAFLPSDKAGPKRLIILIMFAFVGGVIGTLIALLKEFFFKGKSNEES